MFEPIPGGVWMPIFTLPRNEKKLFEKLRNREIPAYLPLKKHINIQPVISKGKNYCYKRVLRVPMFPNYLFANITPELRPELNRDRSIIRILPVKQEEEANLLRELNLVHEIEKLFENEEIEVTNGLRAGQKIIFIEGPLIGWTGVISSLGEKGMVSVNITSIQASIQAKYPITWCKLCEGEEI